MKATNKTMEKAKKKANKLTRDKSYENRLYKVVDSPVPEKILKSGNRNKSWRYGWNPEYDFVNISLDGTIGEFYWIQGLIVAIPEAKNIYSRSDEKSEQYWEIEPSPDDKLMKKFKSTKQLQRLPIDKKMKWEDFIIQEWERREQGHFFMNEGSPCYVTGSHYFFLRWAKIDVGAPHYRESNRIFWYFWEACKADQRSLGMCYLKNRRSGFSYMAMSETINQSSKPPNEMQYGMLSKTGADAQSMFTVKCVKIANNLPFFFQPIRAGESNPKSEILFSVPSKKLTRKTMNDLDFLDDDDQNDGLGNKINHKTTNNNSYDGEKLRLLVHDESGKWVAPNDIRNNWAVVKTCLITGSKVVGKCMMGSTSNKLKEGGESFKEMYESSDLRRDDARNASGETSSGLYSLFIPMEWNVEGKIDIYGKPVFTTPDKPRLDPEQDWILEGAVEWWDNKVEGLKRYPARQNEHIRQFPRTENHAFRDEISGSLFNIVKINNQIDYNDELEVGRKHVQTGDFHWEQGIKDSKVVFSPNKSGRFKVCWFPEPRLQNKIITKDGGHYPGNEHLGAFGCDPYDIDVVNHGFGSNGALHGITTQNVENAPSMQFFLEYVARPQTATIFFEEILMACVFYGMPILIENNKPGILRYFRNRGYKNFAMLRPDKRKHELKPSDLSLRGIPNNSEDVKQMHASMIQSYIEEYIGEDEDGNIGYMPFNRTLQDWLRFDLRNRTDYDASISSGLALMAVRKHIITPPAEIRNRTLSVPFGRYNNQGGRSKLI